VSAWAASSAGIIVIGVCAVLLHQAGSHGHRLPSRFHPWLYRLLIFGMYVGACAVALTALGRYVISAEDWTAQQLGGVQAGAGHDIAVIGGVIILAVVVLGIAFAPGPDVAWFALALPFAAALSGGHLHGVLTVFPAGEWSATVSNWIGG
jgi:hypothetical protein